MSTRFKAEMGIKGKARRPPKAVSCRNIVKGSYVHQAAIASLGTSGPGPSQGQLDPSPAAPRRALAAYGLPSGALDYVVVNTEPVSADVQARYALAGAEPVRVDLAPFAGPPLIVSADVLDPGPVVRHAPDKLGPILCELAAGHLAPEEDGG